MFLISSFAFCQEKSALFNEINHHMENGDFRSENIELFTDKKQVFNNKDKYLSLKIEEQKINSIIEKSDKFISFKIPFSETESKIVLLKKRQLLDDEFKLAIPELNAKNESASKPKYVAYTGLVKNNFEQSLVSVIFYNNEMQLSIFINDKEFTITKIDENENTYKIQEVRIDENQPALACGVRDEDNVNLKEAVTERSQQTTIPKCVKLHFEITKTLNDQFGGISQTILQFFNHFNLVQTKFANEGITVRVSYLKIWNTDDPYYQSWYGSPGSPGAFQDLGFQSFQSLGGNINGNIGILLGTFIGGVAGLSGGAPCPNQGYNAVSIFENSLNQNSATIMHEIGHSFGSHHTHWCGWIGGALDNCAATEGGCPPGPAPTNGGTIMSYCGGYYQINNGFGTQPNGVINNTVTNESCITSCNSEITCEDNIVNVSSVSNSSATSFTINWTANYPIKVYYKELSASNFTLLSTVQLPVNNYSINFVPAINCTIQKFEIKLVSVCPNGDSKPTVIVYSPQAHLKPTVGILDNYLCNVLNPTINNLVATGQNLKWYTTQTIGTPILSSYIFPLNTYIELFVSQTVNGCESERTRAVVYFQNVSTPVGPNNYEFGCEFLKASDLYSISNLYSSPNSYLRWSSSPTGETYFANDQFGISTNSTYYAENTSLDNLCKSSRLPVYITTNPTYYNVPFIENFENPFNCQLGYASPYFGNNSGNQVNNTLTLNNYTLTGINNYVVTKKVNLIANIPVQIFFNAKLLNSNSTIIPLKIKINSNATSQVILGQVNPVSVDNYSQYSFNYTPTVSTQYRVFFEYSCPAQNIGFVIDNFGITNNLDINDFENLNSLIQYPNPTEGYFFIETTVMQINKIEVFDLQGRLLKTIKENKDKYQIDISDFASATYLVKLSTEKGSQTVKIVKK